MNRLYISTFLLICFMLICYGLASGQNVNLMLEVNGMSKNVDELKFQISNGKKFLSPTVNDGHLVVDLSKITSKTNGKVTVRILYARYRIELRDLSIDHLQGQWKVSISDRRFLDLSNVKDGKNVDYGFKIEFNSGDDLGTVSAKIVYKNRRK